MKLRNLKELDKFIKKHKIAQKDIENWISFVQNSHWIRPEDVKKDFPGTRFESSYRLVFKLGYNWRIDVEMDYDHQIIFVFRAGTHEEYNKWKFK